MTSPNKSKSSSSSSRTSTSSSSRSSVPKSSSSTSSSSSKPSSKSSSRVKSSSVKSIKSVSSQSSAESIGIGAAKARQPPPPDAHLRFRLMPEGFGNNVLNVYDQYVFDCLVFVIFCEKHRTVALTNNDPADWTRMYSWFPFIPLQDAFTWSRMSRDGLAIILAKTDAGDDGDQTMAMMPEYTFSWLNILRLQLPRAHKFYSRITQFVKLCRPESGAEVKCCVNNNRIRWLKLSEVSDRCKAISNLWGDEVVSMCRALRTDERIYLSEIDLKNCMPTAEAEAKLLKELNWSESRIHEILEDYVRVLYPAFFMTINSFRSFMLKYGVLSKDDQRIDRLFKAFAAGNESVSFSNLLIGLACMDPDADNELEARAKFIFQYYDQQNKGLLSSSQVAEIFIDLDQSKSRAKEKANSLIKSYGSSNGTLNLSQFADALRDETEFTNANRVLRLEKGFFEAKRSKYKSRSDSNRDEKTPSKSSTNKTSKSASQNNRTEGTCTSHGAHKYEYGLHAATLDNNGRCVDPRIISENWVKQWSSNEMSRDRYSVENVFRGTSVANIFLDLVRGYREQQLEQTECLGLLANNEEDWSMLYQYLETLTEQMLAIVRNEPKILRLTSPLCILGDLQGSLRDLFNFEGNLFRSSPVVSTTLLFLGNYSGPSFTHGFECIVYLFGLKILMPNKVYLLRGRNEIRTFNQGHLRPELLAKYGDDYGEKFFEIINRVFDCLPVAAVVDESIFCTHAGIPELPSDHKLLRTVEKDCANVVEFSNPKVDMPIGYEMMVNVPSRYAHDKEEEAETTQNGFGNSKTGYYRYFSRKAFESFMRTNGFDYLVRSHNPCDDGYALCFDNRCLTIYSCQKCNKTPMTYTALVLINESKRKIRVIRFQVATMSLSSKKSRA